MKASFTSLALAVSGASAALLPRQQCCFQLTAAGGVSGVVGQLSDGQNRVNQGLPAATYCLSGGAITDGSGRGCILTPPTSQFQCDTGAKAETGFTIGAAGAVAYNGSTTFKSCPTGDHGGYNIYETAPAGQGGCVSITLSTVGGTCANSGSGSSSSSKASSATASPSAVSTKASSVTPSVSSSKASSASSVASSVSSKASSASSVVSSVVSSKASSVSSVVSSVASLPSSKASSASFVASSYASSVASSSAKASSVASTSTVPVAAAYPTTTLYSTVYVTVSTCNSASSAPAAIVSASSSKASSASSVASVVSSKASSASSVASSAASASSKPSSAVSSVASSVASSKASSAATSAASVASSSSAKASGSATACQPNLSGAYQTPHLIVPVNSAAPSTAYGTQYNGTVSSTISSIFNFDIPAAYSGHTCSLVFLFPTKAQLQTSAYTTSGSGGLIFTQLTSTASSATTYNNQPAKGAQLAEIAAQPGNSYVVSSGSCAAGTTISVEVSSYGGYALSFFEDYNPSPIGLFLTSC